MIRSSRFAASVVLILTLAASSSYAQASALKQGAAQTTVDGVVSAGEYTWTRVFGPIQLNLNLTADGLYVGVVGTPTGWVAVGLGSLVMNNATIFMGYVDADGKAQFKPQVGSGHRHSNAAQSVSDTIVASAMKEADGKTTLEIQLKRAEYLPAGQTVLNVIFAEGSSDSFAAIHSYRGSVSVPLTQ